MISVIIPIYNVEKYLKQCLDSLMAQTFSDFEVLMVDDGSTDNSKSICNKFLEKDKRFHLISKDNGGVSSARNCGIDYCKGEFIYFLDADDYLDSNALELMIDSIQHFDVLIFGYKLVNEKGFPIRFHSYPECEIYDVKNRYDIITNLRLKVLLNPVFNKLFRRELLVDKFNQDFKMGEDLLFCLSYFKQCKSIKIVSDTVYNYLYRQGSATKQFRSDAVDNKLKLLEYERDFADSFSNQERYEDLYSFYCKCIFDCYISLHGSGMKKNSILSTMSEWSTRICNSNFISYDQNGILSFVKKSLKNQYYYTLGKYGLFRKLIKRLLF